MAIPTRHKKRRPRGRGSNILNSLPTGTRRIELLVLRQGVIPKPRVLSSGARACPELAEGDLPHALRPAQAFDLAGTTNTNAGFAYSATRRTSKFRAQFYSLRKKPCRNANSEKAILKSPPSASAAWE